MSGSNTQGSGNTQGAWHSVPRAWGTHAWQGAQSPVHPNDAATAMDRWRAEPSFASAFNTVGYVRQGHKTHTAPAPAPSTNHATSGSTKQ
ncbi:hypothetical protein MAPG_03478 [Magnaporthiopsis poae ATCC 64411]|uniref:Uncharacterized protein n=1 Tax=Magnaporthiopsis poae (strain ATCC 64411 / 73-15) TaxID=644358 RepID=A0A0C4DU45_MAGP6|nr:hypothetical protein MAPG_03478 [Magnaporthiopsis poae ATCC 64411]